MVKIGGFPSIKNPFSKMIEKRRKLTDIKRNN